MFSYLIPLLGTLAFSSLNTGGGVSTLRVIQISGLLLSLWFTTQLEVSFPFLSFPFLSRILFFFFFFFFCLLVFSRAAPEAYGGSQARGIIGALATSLRQSHSNAGSDPRLQPTPQLTATPDR